MTPEIEIAGAAATWLRSHGLMVYQEVRAQRSHKRCDLIGLGVQLVVAVEAKASFGLDVIAQANAWLSIVSESWVAVPVSRTATPAGQLGVGLCRGLGIGVIGTAGDDASVIVVARPSMHDVSHWLDVLRPEQMDSIGGSAGGGYVTDFSLTADALTRLVRQRERVRLGDAVSAIAHHYATRSSAIAALSGLIESGNCGALARIAMTGKGTRGVLRLRP